MGGFCIYKKLEIVTVDYKYCDYLREFDKRVIYNAGTKKIRPFIGVLFMVENIKYFAPLSSPKPKHKKLKNTLDLIKIKDGEYGVVNLNNMIPLIDGMYTLVDLNKKYVNKKDIFRIELLTNQLRWLTVNREDIYFKSKLLYNLYKNNKLPKNVRNRCCNFILLEEKCIDYKKEITSFVKS